MLDRKCERFNMKDWIPDEEWSKDMSRGKARKELEAIEDKLCMDALDKASTEIDFLNKVTEKWHLQHTPIGTSLVLGRGFDFDSLISLTDNGNVMIQITVRKQGQYPEIAEVVVPIKDLQKLLGECNK